MTELSNGALRRNTGPLSFGYCIIGHKRKLINNFVQIEFRLHVRSMEKIQCARRIIIDRIFDTQVSDYLVV